METTAIDETFTAALQFYASGNAGRAEALCRQLLAVRPRHAAALHLLGALAHRAGHVDDAIGLMRTAISVDPRVAEYHSNLSVALLRQGAFEQAACACREALKLDPGLVDAHYNLGNALREAGRLDEAAMAYRQALARRFDFPQAHNNLGNVLKDLGRLEAAEAAFRQALSLHPGFALARGNLALVLQNGGRLDESVEEHRRAVAAAPSIPALHSNLILGLHHHPDVDAGAIEREGRLWNERHARPLQVFITRHDNDRSPDRTLRIGFVSADLRTHAVAFFLLPLLRAYDRQRLHVTCYSNNVRTDEITARLRESSDAWFSLAGVSDEAAAQRIRDDRIDILFDLGGHTRDHRLTLFTRKPAPVQVGYLGFPGSTGLDAIDHRFTDAVADPPDPAGGERLVRLARSGWCFEAPRDAPVVVEPPAWRNGYPTFGCFNKLDKISPATLQGWAQILHAVPTSHLLLKGLALRDAETGERVRRIFAAQGIAANRLELLPDEPTARTHLQCYERVDIALDSFPYHGTTTTCEALWMGVPVITLAGRRHASRVGASLLATVGLPELVAPTAAAYARLAVQLAGDLPRLASWREGMRRRMQDSPLMDAVSFAHDFEAACREAWRAWCARP